jgi:glycyl-tRNA synthetase
MASQEDVFKKLVAHCKEYGFVFPSREIYAGLGAVYDYGQNNESNKKKQHQKDIGGIAWCFFTRM